jgi:hypothetical protein
VHVSGRQQVRLLLCGAHIILFALITERRTD